MADIIFPSNTITFLDEKFGVIHPKFSLIYTIRQQIPELFPHKNAMKQAFPIH